VSIEYLFSILKVVLPIALPFLAIYVMVMHYVAKQAQARGYSYWNWMLLGLLGNSIIFVVLLALLPDRSLDSRRLAKKKVLADQLRSRPRLPNAAISPVVVHTSMGDMATFDPERIGFSVGDQPTSFGVGQPSSGGQATDQPAVDTSMGDQATRLD
jgi:hypothetical protein